ncbi:MAG: glycyl radical protein [Sedimentisphaerales bacterium]|jgi:formate C-acetyltransferase|nr:glycyl radical protein [Sedimentisphaerales bacterium]HNY76902.1 glycyl radical protein [Sedimentisphaerales bacterium]HOC62756.1 glycyl radical protein [Sedimentisphaerales bacterium]HOH62676.1 glycyl radical protein [Sedimentisphaerales bacterium]HPY49519.1 glycyl radical protein [Sedimentisphaerales bacterium]
MNERVRKLRQQSVETHPYISSERAELMTQFYQSGAAWCESVPVTRALAFRHLMEHKTVYIGDGELIVGEKGHAPKATPTYPELCCHTLSDLDILNSREKTSFAVSPEVRKVYAETIIPFWQDRTMRERIFREMTDEWKATYEAGLFTEFMEQRSPGHTVLDDKIYRKGMLDFKQDIQRSLDSLDYLNDPQAYARQEQLKAMRICADALIRFAERHAEKAREIAKRESDPQRKAELERIAQVCSHVPGHAPRDFWEALQYYWFVHLGVTTEMNPWDSFNPGRLDQHLYPFYRRGLDEGTLTAEHARELLQCFWVKFNNQPAPPKVGVTAAESGTYTDFAQINSGGLKEDGSDGVNEVTFLVLDVVEEMRLVQPSSSIQVSKKNPDRFIKRATKIIRTGFGQPSVFNCDLIVQELVRMGKSVADARNGGSSGCVEVGAFGKESYILTGYFNLPKVLELTLNNGVDPRTGQRLGPQTGDPERLGTFEQLFDAFRQQVHYLMDIKMRGNNVIERLYATYMPAPFLSILIDDCIAKGKDYHDGGARYNTNYVQGVGLGTITDALTAIKYHVFDRKSVSMSQLLSALRSDFEGEESLRQTLLERTPKYGNDDDYADDVMRSVFEVYFDAVDGRPNTKGGRYHINLLPTTVHVYFGSVIGATPDGRKAGLPLSEGISPVQGADRYGPTAVLKSAAKMDHARTGGTLLNMKFNPQVLDGEESLDKLTQLIRSYFRLDGHHIQFNVVGAETLREAQKHPERNRDLIVRVAGYSDYFVDLGRDLQNEIIARTEQSAL